MVVMIPARGPVATGFGDCRALILDPVTASRRLLRDMLCMAEVGAVGCCADPSEAWSGLMAAGTARTLLFLDWSNRCDAPALLTALRAAGHPVRFLPVVVMSGFHGMAAAGRARDAGATEYMLKPFSLDVVRSRLRAALFQPRLFVAADGYFGPDRRRRRLPPADNGERRRHENWQAPDRRVAAQPSAGRERRHSHPGFVPMERRSLPR